MTITLIPVTEAAHEFVRRTGSDYLAAQAYLPTVEIEGCEQCDLYAEHTHPRKALLTQAEIDQAVAAYGQARFEEEYDL